MVGLEGEGDLEKLLGTTVASRCGCKRGDGTFGRAEWRGEERVEHKHTYKLSAVACREIATERERERD